MSANLTRLSIKDLELLLTIQQEKLVKEVEAKQVAEEEAAKKAEEKAKAKARAKARKAAAGKKRKAMEVEGSDSDVELGPSQRNGKGKARAASVGSTGQVEVAE